MTPWLYRIATNACYDALRRRRLIIWQTLDELDHEPASGTGDDPQEGYGGTAEMVRAALARMPALYRQALLLREYEGYSSAGDCSGPGHRAERRQDVSVTSAGPFQAPLP